MAWYRQGFNVVPAALQAASAAFVPDDTVGTIDGQGPALREGPCEAYNEDAFQYFLEIERKRSELSARPLLVMLVDFRNDPTIHPPVDDATAHMLFSALSSCVRETDFIGWYQEGRIAGAVLTQNEDSSAGELSEVVLDRLREALRRCLPADLDARLQVRVQQLPVMGESRRMA